MSNVNDSQNELILAERNHVCHKKKEKRPVKFTLATVPLQGGGT
jgi:hypothetical protein